MDRADSGMIAARSACNKKHDAENQICCRLFFMLFPFFRQLEAPDQQFFRHVPS